MQVGDLVDGRYRILELLGEGAAGKVFRAEDRGRNNMFIALKLLHAKDPRWENFFRREFDVLSRLHHPNLVRVFDFGPAPEENTWYFTQELVVGKPILNEVAGKKVDEVAALFVEICRALEFIHGHGVLHRDLKPANILVQMHAPPGERVRVLDFGLWRELDPTPQRGARWAGTPPYLASEVLRGHGHSISADLYAVGVTLFQAVTRKLPHGRGTPQELLAARKAPAPDLTGVVAQPLVDLIARLLDEYPPHRPQSAAEVASALAALVPHAGMTLPLALGRARLVGREAERGRLSDAVRDLREAVPGAPRLVIVEGPDGVGKSRLVGELKAEVQLEGGRSAIGRCMEDVRWSYQPISELTRALAPASARLASHEREVVERLCPELSDVPAALDNPLPKTERERFHQAASDLFLGLASEKPCVLIIEDVPCADAATLSLLATLLRRAQEGRLLLVVTAGPSDVYGPVPPELLEAVQGRALHIALSPLLREEVGKLLAALLAVQPADVPDALLDTVEAHSQGNPLLVEELVALFIERGELRRGERGWLLDEFDSAAVAPKQLLEVLSERLQRLGDVERRALSALAVLGRPSGPRLLSAIAGVSTGEVRQALASAENTGLLRVVGEEGGRPRVVFRHPQIRDVLLDDLRQGGVLKVWHETAADVLEERATERDKGPALAETLAYHYEQAGLAEPALRWLMEASEHAIATFAFDDAIRLARRASKLLLRARAEIEVVVESDLLIGKALLFAGRIPEARAFLEGAVARADAVQAPEAFGELHVWLSRACNQMGAVDQGRHAVDRGLELLSAEEHPLAYARLLVARGELNQRVDPASALVDAEHGLRLMPEPRQVGDELNAFEVLTVAAYYAGERDHSIRYARHRVKLADDTGRALDKITALRHLATSLGVVGQRVEARRHLNQALKLARDAGYRVEEALLVKALGDQLYVSGAYDEAIVRFQEAAKLSAQMGQQADRADALKYLGECYLARGEYDRAVDHIQAALEQFDRSGQLANIIAARCYLANALIAKGQVEEAERVLRAAAEQLPEDGLANARAEVYGSQGNLFSAQGDFKRARIAYLHCAALSRRSQDWFTLGEALVGYGQLLLRFRKAARALRMARRAEGIFTNLDARGQLRRIKPLLNAARGLASAG